MKQVLSHIAAQASDFRAKPLFAYLRDTRIEPRIRLTFIPYIAHFVLTFADLRVLLVEQPPRDRCQELVNLHVAEEDGHWNWFLADLVTMEMDPVIHFTEALRFVWGASTAKTRGLSYEICRLAGNSSSLHKLVLLLAVEGTAGVAFEAAAATARELELASGRKLAYFGQRHLQAEEGHSAKQGDTNRFLEEITVSASIRVELHAMIDSVFRHFGAFVDESFALARKGAGFAKVPDA